MNPNIINKKRNLFSLTKEESIVRGTNNCLLYTSDAADE